MKLLARFLLLAGALGVGWFLFRAAPRDVVLVYGMGPSAGPAVLEVDVLRRTAQGRDELVRHAELAAPAAGGELRHPVRLPDGSYLLRWRLGQGAAARAGERAIEVSEDATLVLPLTP